MTLNALEDSFLAQSKNVRMKGLTKIALKVKVQG